MKGYQRSFVISPKHVGKFVEQGLCPSSVNLKNTNMVGISCNWECRSCWYKALGIHNSQVKGV